MSNNVQVYNPLVGDYNVRSTETAEKKQIQHVRLDLGVGSAEAQAEGSLPVEVTNALSIDFPASLDVNVTNASLPISGTVGISGTAAVSIAEAVTVTPNGGAMPISGTVGVSGTIPISGSVTVSAQELTELVYFAQLAKQALSYLTAPGWHDLPTNRVRSTAVIESGTVTTVSTVTNQTSLGGSPAQLAAMGANETSWQLAVRSRIG